MTKEQLANIEAKKVRSDANLFALFRKYVTEDAGLLYSSGKLPQGCFGCQFNTLFTKWKNIYTTPKKLTKSNAMAQSNKTYELKNPATKFFFKGSILSFKSSGDAWLEWINYPADAVKVESRKAYFKKLPQEQNTEVNEQPVDSDEVKPKRSRRKKAE